MNKISHKKISIKFLTDKESIECNGDVEFIKDYENNSINYMQGNSTDLIKLHISAPNKTIERMTEEAFVAHVYLSNGSFHSIKCENAKLERGDPDNTQVLSVLILNRSAPIEFSE